MEKLTLRACRDRPAPSPAVFGIGDREMAGVACNLRLMNVLDGCVQSLGKSECLTQQTKIVESSVTMPLLCVHVEQAS